MCQNNYPHPSRTTAVADGDRLQGGGRIGVGGGIVLGFLRIKKGRSAVAGEPSFLRRPPTQRQCKRPRIGDAIKKLLFFLLGDFFLRNFLCGFLYRFFLSCFLFCHGLDHLLSSVLNCEKDLSFSDNYTVLSSYFARSLEAFYGSMREKRTRIAMIRRVNSASAAALTSNRAAFFSARQNMRLIRRYKGDWMIAIVR
jgi:hypothetical protein